MSYVNIMVHAVWGTKNRHHVLSSDLRSKVCTHIKENAITKGIDIDTINGHTDHLHALMSLKADLAISTQMQLIKGESAHWINANQLLKSHFGWASEFYAQSVSPSQLDTVRAYINNQEEHHRKKSFREESDELMKNILRSKGYGHNSE